MRLAAQGVDDVAVVDHMAAARLPVDAAPASQGLHQGAAEEALQPIIIQPDAQTMADQPRGNTIKDTAQEEPAAAGDGDQHFLEVVGATRRQRLELRPLDLQRLAPARIGAADHLVDKAAIGVEIGKVALPRSSRAC